MEEEKKVAEQAAAPTAPAEAPKEENRENRRPRGERGDRRPRGDRRGERRPRDEQEKEFEEGNFDKLKNYILKLPIIIACSLHVQNAPDKFVPEYVISQQVFQWLMSELRENLKRNKANVNMTVGIAYTSAKKELWESMSRHELQDESQMTNYALLSYLLQDEKVNTYSTELAKKIKARTPIWITERLSPHTSTYEILESIEKRLTKPKCSRWKGIVTYIK